MTEPTWFGRYLTPSEIVEDLLDHRMGVKDRIDFRKMPENDLIGLHHSLGMWIRNFYGLWREDNPYTKVNAAPNAEGVIDDPLFPDQVSQSIIRAAWKRLQMS